MTRGGLLQSSKKYLSWMALALLVFMAMLSPRAFAADSGGGRACDDTTRPSPYTNGAPVVRTFYPADGSTVTVTSTGAVIKQSPCGNPYREGWVNPANICNLNSFDQLGGMINKSDSSPNPNSDPVYTCNAAAPAPSPAPAPVAVSSSTSRVTVNPTPVRPTEVDTHHGVVKSQTTTNPAPATTALPNTGTSAVSFLTVGGASTLLGTLGHFFYRRRAFN